MPITHSDSPSQIKLAHFRNHTIELLTEVYARCHFRTLFSAKPHLPYDGLNAYWSVVHMIALSIQIQDYLSNCENQKNLNSHTLKAYRIDLRQFDEFYVANNAALDKTYLSGYISDIIKGSGQSRPSVKSHR